MAVPLTDRFANTQRDNPPARGQAFFWDTDTKGFGLRTTERGCRLGFCSIDAMAALSVFQSEIDQNGPPGRHARGRRN